MDGAADTAEAVVSDDAEPVDRDRLDPLTLRFVDPALERDFQIATLEGARRRHRWGMFINIPLWIVGPALAIAVFPSIDPRPILIGATVMITMLAVVGILGGRATIRRRVDIYGSVLNAAAGIIVLLLTVSAGLFATFGPVLIVFSGMIAVGVQRIPFTFAAAVMVSHVTVFTILATQFGTGAPFEVFLVVSALLVALSGTYLVESSERRVFAQGRLIAELHARVDDLLRHYLSPEVAASLIAHPSRADLGGDEVEITACSPI